MRSRGGLKQHKTETDQPYQSADKELQVGFWLDPNALVIFQCSGKSNLKQTETVDQLAWRLSRDVWSPKEVIRARRMLLMENIRELTALFQNRIAISRIVLRTKLYCVRGRAMHDPTVIGRTPPID